MMRMIRSRFSWRSRVTRNRTFMSAHGRVKSWDSGLSLPRIAFPPLRIFPPPENDHISFLSQIKGMLAEEDCKSFVYTGGEGDHDCKQYDNRVRKCIPADGCRDSSGQKCIPYHAVCAKMGAMAWNEDPLLLPEHGATQRFSLNNCWAVGGWFVVEDILRGSTGQTPIDLPLRPCLGRPNESTQSVSV